MKEVEKLTVEERMVQQEMESVKNRLYEEREKLIIQLEGGRLLSTLTKAEAKALKGTIRAGKAFNKAQMQLEKHGLMLNFSTTSEGSPMLYVEASERVQNSNTVRWAHSQAVNKNYDDAVGLIFRIAREGRVELMQTLDKLACFKSLRLKLSAIHVAKPWF
jgi:hypothetical protein